ncbi:MAG: hypothetical protein JZU53_04700 [Paludibacter sp.]|nr:hypothetical protein [Paludibacter sp.]
MSKKKNEISKEDQAFVVLVKSGKFRAADAFRLLFDSKANDASLLTLSSKKKTALAEWFEDDEDEAVENLEEFDSGDDELDKAALIRKFTRIASRSKDDKVKLAAYEKIANIKNMKKEVESKEVDDVKFYTPARCIEDCHLYAAEKKRKEALAQ